MKQSVLKDSFGLYIHVPFCKSRCSYCDFCRITDYSKVEGYLKAIKKESTFNPFYGEKPDTVYIGGGTPSSLNNNYANKLLDMVEKSYDLSNVVEFTYECNPDDVKEELIFSLMKHGVNRVSMGVQSLNDDALKMMNRRHDAEKARDAFMKLRKCGIKNISVDLIFGLPKVKGYDVEREIERFIELGAEHVSAYSLSYEEGSVMTKRKKEKAIFPLEDDEVFSQYEMIAKKMKEAGYAHYEISNYSKPGYESVHNSSYWMRKQYVGLGPSAASLIGNVRKTNVGNVEEYVEKIMEGKVFYEEEKLSEEDVYNEMVMLNLRTCGGMDINEVKGKFRPHFENEIDKFMKSGHVIKEGDVFKIKEDAWFVSDMILSRLFI